MRKDISFKGVFTAMVTPFTKKDLLDEDMLEQIIEMQIASGVPVWFPVVLPAKARLSAMMSMTGSSPLP